MPPSDPSREPAPEQREAAGRRLRDAVWRGDLAGVAAALDLAPGAVGEPGPHPVWGGRPDPLQLAAERGRLEIARLLLQRGAGVEGHLEGYGWSPLQLAAHWNHRPVAELLLEHGARLDIATAGLLGDADAVARLLEEDPALATAPALDGAPPLHHAATPRVARLLLGRGASLERVDPRGAAPLDSALGRGPRGRSVAALLIERGARPDPCQLAALGWTEGLLRMIDADPGALAFRGRIGVHQVAGTPLHAAAHAGHGALAAVLIERGADVDARADMGQRPLHLCAAAGLARLLVEAGADPAAVDDEHGTTPLTWTRVGLEIHGDTPARRRLVEYLEQVTAERPRVPRPRSSSPGRE